MFLFLLINVFLSIIGTFWLRINRKKEEIGIRMAMGSSRLKIQLYFISESLVLISAALIPALLIVLQVLYFKGLFVFAQVKAVAGSFPAVNNPALHFCVVSLLIWLFFLLIGIIGTSFPAWHASRVNPIDALRDQ